MDIDLDKVAALNPSRCVEEMLLVTCSAFSCQCCEFNIWVDHHKKACKVLADLGVLLRDLIVVTKE